MMVCFFLGDLMVLSVTEGKCGARTKTTNKPTIVEHILLLLLHLTYKNLLSTHLYQYNSFQCKPPTSKLARAKSAMINPASAVGHRKIGSLALHPASNDSY